MTTVQTQSPVVQQRPTPPKPPVTPNPYVEQYIQGELASVGHFRKIGGLVLLHDLAKDGIGASDKLALRLALRKYGDKIDPDARALFNNALEVDGRVTEKRLKYDAQLVREYVGYVMDDAKITGAEADYLLVTARNIGGSKAVKAELSMQLARNADAFEPDAREKITAFIKG